MNPYDWEDEDPLAAARGICFAFVLGAVFWMVIAACLYLLIH